MMRGAILAGWVGMAGAAQAQPINPSFAPPPGPAGMIAMAPDGSAPVGTLDQLARGTHGYLSTGVSSGGGRGVEGDVLVPVVPGQVTLEVGGGTGRTPVWVATGRGAKTVAADTSAYHVAVHARVTDDLDVTVAFSQDTLKVR